MTALLPVWLDIGLASQEGGPVIGYYSASEQRVEAALRWQYNHWGRDPAADHRDRGSVRRPQLRSPPSKTSTSITCRPASTATSGLIGGRLFFTQKFVARLGFTFCQDPKPRASTPAYDGAGQPLFQTNGFRSYGPGRWRLGGWSLHKPRPHKGLTSAPGSSTSRTSSFQGQGNVYRERSADPGERAAQGREHISVMITPRLRLPPFIRW